jgi:hypothetical protein
MSPPRQRQRKRIALAVNFLASAYQMTLRQAVERATLSGSIANYAGSAGLISRRPAHRPRGDLLVLHTDGVTEASSSFGQQFGIERLCLVIERHASLPVQEIHAALLRELEAWSPVLRDDVTCIILRRLPGPGPSNR